MTDHTQFEKTAILLQDTVRNEDVLRNNRTNWLGQSQGLLFASLGFAWGKSHALTQILAGLGIATAAIILLGFLAGTTAQLRALKIWRNTRPTNYKGPEVFGYIIDGLPPVLFYFSPENFLPVAYIVGWILVLYIA